MSPGATTNRTADVLVVGAGPIGLATAIALRQQGVDVCVMDRGRYPYDKACGEGLMPAGCEALQALGIDPFLLEAAPCRGIRYIDGTLQVTGYFDSAGGLGVRRTALVAALRRRAEVLGIALYDECQLRSFEDEAHGVTVHTTQGSWRAQLLVAADGLHSGIRRTLGVTGSAANGSRRYGARRHYACAPWSDCIDVHWADGCEAYVTPVSPQCVGVAFLWGPEPQRFEDLLQRFASLAARLEGVPVMSKVRGAGPLNQPVLSRYKGHVVLVGDAGGYLDALTGEGLTLGFLCALALAPIVRAGAPLQQYEQVYRKLSRPYYREASLLLALARRPRLRRWAMRLLAYWPRLFQAFITAHGKRRLPRLGDFMSFSRHTQLSKDQARTTSIVS